MEENKEHNFDERGHKDNTTYRLNNNYYPDGNYLFMSAVRDRLISVQNTSALLLNKCTCTQISM